MFPKISDLFNYLFGSHLDLPVQTYGFFLALAAVVAGFVLNQELKRKEKEGKLLAVTRNFQAGKASRWSEIIPGVILSSVFAWKFFGIVFQYRLFASNPQSYILSGQGSIPAMILTAIISATYHLVKRASLKNHNEENTEQTVHPYQYTWNIMVVGLIFAIAGSKLFDIFDNFGSFLKNPIHSLLSFNGLTFYGGFIVTVIAELIYMKVIKLDWKHVIDCTAPVIMIGYAIGRLGCHFSGDGCWGIVNALTQPKGLTWLPDWLWASAYPHNVINRGVLMDGCVGSHCMVLPNPVFPTSLYESIVSFVLFAALWTLRKRIQAPVVLFGIFMVLNGLERFCIEKIRINNKYEILGFHLSQAEIISTLLFFSGIAVIVLFSRKYRHSKEQSEANCT